MSKVALVAAVAALGLLVGGALVIASSRPPAAPPGRVAVPAPIDGLEVERRESTPPQYVLFIQAGLPGGCAQRDRHEVRREPDVITITVLNSLPPGDPICTAIYGTYGLEVGLGSDFVPGRAYTVRVNDRTTSFTAR